MILQELIAHYATNSKRWKKKKEELFIHIGETSTLLGFLRGGIKLLAIVFL